MDFATLLSAAMRKRAAAILTPEAMQAAGAIPEAPQGGMVPPQDMSPDMGGMPPQEMPQPDMQQGMAMQGVGSGGGQIPPEIMQDQQFIQWLASQGIQLNPQTGQFVGPDGQALPVDVIVQAYQEFQAMMQQQSAAMSPQEAQPQQMPAQGADMSMPQQGTQQGTQQGGQLPPEILQDQMFLQFMAEVGGMQPDQSGQFIDMQTGQPVPPDFIMQAYQEFQMQMQQQQEQGDQMPDYGSQPMQPEQMPPQNQAGGAMPSEVLDQIQTMLDSTLQAYTASIEKRLEAFNDKLDAVKTAIESIGNKDDQRQPVDKDEAEMLRQELANELQPTVKTAAAKPASKPTFSAPKPINMFDMLINKR